MAYLQILLAILVHNNAFQVFVMYNLVYQLQCSSIKFCNYKFMLNEALNYNDVTRVANIMLNESPKNNDATRVANNVCLNIMGAKNSQ